MNAQLAVEEAGSGPGDGDRDAVDRLFPRVYDDLHAIATRQLRRGGAREGLEAEELVHEAYLRLVRQRRVPEDSLAHFLALAVQVMHRVLLDHVRRRQAVRRGGSLRRIPLCDGFLFVGETQDTSLEINEALGRLGEVDPRMRQVVEFRFFGGLTEEETAEALHVTARTVRRDWTRAKCWLYREMDAAAAAG